MTEPLPTSYDPDPHWTLQQRAEKAEAERDSAVEAGARWIGKLAEVEAENERLREALRSLVEGNLGDGIGYANYQRIIEYARAALEGR